MEGAGTVSSVTTDSEFSRNGQRLPEAPHRLGRFSPFGRRSITAVSASTVSV